MLRALLADIACMRADSQKTMPSGASITTHCSGVLNRSTPNEVRSIRPSGPVVVASILVP